MNNKILSIILIILLALFGINKVFKGKKTASFDKTFLALNTAEIDRIEVDPKGDAQGYSLEKDDAEWTGKLNGKPHRLNQDRVNSFLSSLENIQIQRLASKSPDKWINYEVDAEKGTRLKAYDGNDLLADFIVGRFSFDQQTRSATSYLRKYEEDEVFAMDGFASMTYNQDFNGLRYNKLVDIPSEQLSSITLQMEGQSQSIRKDGTLWKDIVGNPLDSASVSQYVNRIAALSSSKMVEDNNVIAGLSPMGKMTLSTGNGIDQEVIMYPDSSSFFVQSGADPDLIVTSDSTDIFKSLVTDFFELFSDN